MQDLEFRALVERIKLRSPIEVVVGERVPGLRKQGALFWARCPFHEERTPSFAVDPRRGTWRCYGACGEGGDVIHFVERFDGLAFLDAVRMLGRGAGENVPERLERRDRPGAERENERLEQLLDLLKRSAARYARLLWTPEGSRALAYIRGRGFTDETLAEFEIGWA